MLRGDERFIDHAEDASVSVTGRFLCKDPITYFNCGASAGEEHEICERANGQGDVNGETIGLARILRHGLGDATAAPEEDGIRLSAAALPRRRTTVAISGPLAGAERMTVFAPAAR